MFVYQHHRKILLAWLISLVVCAVALALRPAELKETELDGAHGTEAEQVQLLLRDGFGQKLGSSAAVVTTGDLDGVALAAGLREAFPAIARVRELSGRTAHRTRLFQLLFDPAVPLAEAQALTPALRAHVAAFARKTGARAQLTGATAFQYDAKTASKRDSARGERASLLVSLLVLVFTLGALTAALLPLLVGATTLLYYNAAVAWLGLPANPVSKVLSGLVGLALAIDYAIFMVGRFREELAKGQTPRAALEATWREPRRAIGASALVMGLSVSVLAIPDVSLVRTVVLDLLVVVGLSWAVSAFLLPAWLLYKPEWLERPRFLARWIRRADWEPFWRALAERVVARPKTCFVLACALLAALAAPALGLKLWEPVQAIAPHDSESKRAYDALEADGWGGELMPVQLIVRAAPGERVYAPGTIAYVDRLTRALEALPEVAAVQSLTSWQPRYGLGDYQRFYRAYGQLGWLAEGGPARLVGHSEAAAGRATSDVTLVQVFPRHLMAQADTDAILAAARAYAQAHPERPVLVGGAVARVRDFTHELYRAAPALVAGVVLAILVVLGVHMRSVVLPLKAAVMNFLPLAGAFGVLTLVFQHGWGAGWLHTPVNGALTNIVPLMLFCIVFGLSMDYEVLMLSRINEAHKTTGDVASAVVSGLSRSGASITGAALILLGVFATGIGSSSPQTQEICLGLTAALLIDATIVRFLLVPSCMVLLGRWNWWLPSFLRPESRV